MVLKSSPHALLRSGARLTLSQVKRMFTDLFLPDRIQKFDGGALQVHAPEFNAQLCSVAPIPP